MGCLLLVDFKSYRIKHSGAQYCETEKEENFTSPDTMMEVDRIGQRQRTRKSREMVIKGCG